ncbi:hypothetical protein BDN67DRAFT_981990 [Paxillus ammoniavirescens]|nr:hypothetical protein BDN67DRAFT_981990 [Paxillus ammoniavirescens]
MCYVFDTLRYPRSRIFQRPSGKQHSSFARTETAPKIPPHSRVSLSTQQRYQRNFTDDRERVQSVVLITGNGILWHSDTFGSYEVQHQAFVHAGKRSICGVSEMEREATTKMARPIMSSLCAQHPSTTFIGLALQRSNGENTSGSVFSVGEYDPRFANVSGTPKHPVTPPPSSRWTVAMSGMSIHGNDHTLKSDVEGMQKGQAITLIDSGTSLVYIPSDAVDGIYSVIEGAVYVKTKDQDSWSTEILRDARA